MKTAKRISAAVSLLLLAILLVSCAPNSVSGIWESATYKKDTEIGTGSKTVTVTVTAEEKSVAFTVHTDKDTLGEALLELGLISGEQGAYGLYVKTVNGMLADYDIDQTYWSFTSNGESLNYGVDGANISGGESFGLTRTK